MLFDFKNQTETSTDLYIYGDIVSENLPDWEGNVSETAVDLKLFKDTINGLGKGQTLNIFINSGGGSVFAASTMVSMIKRAQDRGARVISYIDGLAASAASLFPMVADECHLYRNSMLMLHKPLAFLFGYLNATDLSKLADELDAVESGVMLPLYNSRSKLSEQRTKNLVAAETWMNAEQIMETFDGFTLHEEEKKVAACASVYYDRYMNTPAGLISKPEPKPEPQSKKPDYSAYRNILNSLKRKED